MLNQISLNWLNGGITSFRSFFLIAFSDHIWFFVKYVCFQFRYFHFKDNFLYVLELFQIQVLFTQSASSVTELLMNTRSVVLGEMGPCVFVRILTLRTAISAVQLVSKICFHLYVELDSDWHRLKASITIAKILKKQDKLVFPVFLLLASYLIWIIFIKQT